MYPPITTTRARLIQTGSMSRIQAGGSYQQRRDARSAGPATVTWMEWRYPGVVLRCKT